MIVDKKIDEPGFTGINGVKIVGTNNKFGIKNLNTNNHTPVLDVTYQTLLLGSHTQRNMASTEENSSFDVAIFDKLN